MTTRRKFIQASLALQAICLAAGTALSPRARAAGADTAELERFLYDVRFAESYDMGEYVASLGVEPAPYADDLMTLWYEELDLRWKQAPMTLAGVTLGEALFILETFAMDRRMRVIYRGEHSAVENGRILHRLEGPAGMLDGLKTVTENSDWERSLSVAMTQCPLGKQATAALEFETVAPSLALRDMPLFSWVIAPQAASR